MDDSATPRLASALLEDMAIVALTARPDAERMKLHPQLEDRRRATLRARLKHVARHEWPATLQQDPLLRRGYTLRQCFRLIAALMIMDAQLAPGLAVPLAANNEAAFMKAIAARLSVCESTAVPNATDLICVIVLGELWEQVDFQSWSTAEPLRVRLVERGRAHECWSSDLDLAVSGQRLLIDIGSAAQAAWTWMRERRLMPGDALNVLLAEIGGRDASVAYVPVMERSARR